MFNRKAKIFEILERRNQDRWHPEAFYETDKKPTGEADERRVVKERKSWLVAPSLKREPEAAKHDLELRQNVRSTPERLWPGAAAYRSAWREPRAKGADTWGVGPCVCRFESFWEKKTILKTKTRNVL